MLGAWLDAFLAGASSWDADDIAKVIVRRPRPSYEERLAVFNATGRPEHSHGPVPGRFGTDADFVPVRYLARLRWHPHAAARTAR